MSLLELHQKRCLYLDGDVLCDKKDPEFTIEQNTCGVFKESFIQYLGEHLVNGELYVMFSPESTAFLYRKS